MATRLEEIANLSQEIKKICNDESSGIKRNMTTFNYVYNYLDNWATNAQVGTTVRENINILNQAIGSLRERTVELCNVIEEYASNQTSTDNGRS